MKDRDLFVKTVLWGNGLFKDGKPEEWIDKFSRELEVELPKSYKEFLREFGSGGFGSYVVNGIETEDFSSMKNETLKYRNKINLPKELVVVQQRIRPSIGETFLTCLDTKRMNNGECPTVRYDLETNVISEYTETFEEAFYEGILEVYNTKVIPRIQEQPRLKEFPVGVGYKACWMTIVGSTQKAIVDALGIKNVVEAEHRESVEVLKKSQNKVIITSDYDGKNYVIFRDIMDFFSEDVIMNKCAEFPEVYAYLNQPITGNRGFLKAVKGQIERMYYRDGEKIVDLGKPLPEEKKEKVKLARTFEEVRSGKYTRFNEDLILTLAAYNSMVDIGKYPYEKVLLGDI